MIEAATINFQDAETFDDAVLILRYNADHVALALSLKLDGDMMVVMTKEKARALRDALNTAIT